MVSCMNCQRALYLNKIVLCMEHKCQVDPIPGQICKEFVKRKYKMPMLVITDENISDGNSEGKHA